MNDLHDTDAVAGGHPPATAPSDAQPSWQVVLWPHRSLSRRGFRIFLTVLGVFFFVFGAMTFNAPGYDVAWSAQFRVFLVVAFFMVSVFALIWWLFLRNYADARYHEWIALFDNRLVIEARHPKRDTKRWELKPYWTKVTTRTTSRIENQILLSASGKVITIGAFLTPEERAALALEIEDALGRFA